MSKQIIISESNGIAALLENERVEELIVSQNDYQVGDIYFGIVENVLPGIEAAFINVGDTDKNGFIHISDLGPLRLRDDDVGIAYLLEPRQNVLVQVLKEATGAKGPRLTGNIQLSGRFRVLQFFEKGIKNSNKIKSKEIRKRKSSLLEEIKGPDYGLLVLPQAENINDELLKLDLKEILIKWESILPKSPVNPPELILRDQDLINRALTAYLDSDSVRVIV